MRATLDIVGLLDSAGPIVHKHMVEYRRQGLGFNLFEILDRGTDEVRGHSAFLAELFRPNGSHGQGDIFLRAFLKELADAGGELAGHLPGLPGGWSVSIEQRCSRHSRGASGRIDILLENGDVWVVIENKIYAGDQDDQLARYAAWAGQNGKRAALVYLTLDGCEPGRHSLGKLSASEVLCISYQVTVDQWIERCAELCHALPVIRESLNQYQRLIGRLTGTGVRKALTMDLADHLADRTRLESALEIARAIPAAKSAVQFNFLKDLEDILAERVPKPEDAVSGIEISRKNVDLIRVKEERKRYVGLSYDLYALSPTRRLVFQIASRDTMYFVIAAIENRERANLNPDERQRIRKVFSDKCSAHNLSTGKQDWPEWGYALIALNFKEFGPKCVELADADHRRRMAEKVADEMMELLAVLCEEIPLAFAVAG